MAGNDELLTILLVEDDAAHAALLKRGCTGHRVAHQIVHVLDGEAALDYLFQKGCYADPQQNPRPKLILLDLRLPRIDGLEVLAKIKFSQELRDIPVVVLTTSKAEQDVSRAYACHANSFLVKPADFSKFSQLMNDLLTFWGGWNHQPSSLAKS